MRIKFLKLCMIDGVRQEIGSTIDQPIDIAKYLIRIGKAEEFNEEKDSTEQKNKTEITKENNKKSVKRTKRSKKVNKN